MSVLNAWLSRGRGLLGVDTEVFAPDGQSIGHTSKMIPLVHMNAAFGFRGQFAVLAVLHSLVVWRPIGFDALVDELPELLAESVRMATGALAQAFAAPGLQAPLNLLDLVLIGYSRRSGDVAAHSYSWDQAREKFIGTEIFAEQGFFAPATDYWLDYNMPTSPVTSEKLADMAQRQMELVREKHPVPAAGGEFVVAHIDRRGMVIRSVATLKR